MIGVVGMHCEKCGNELETIYLGLKYDIPCSQPCRRCDLEEELKNIEVKKETHKIYSEELKIWKDIATKSIELAENLDKENKRLSRENLELRYKLYKI